jgi:hypothetical protein
MNITVEKILVGALSGAIGTAAMTVLMKPGLAGLLSPKWRPGEFVPKQVVEWVEERINRPDLLTKGQEMLAASVAHLGYGSTMGAVYGALRDGREGLPAAAAGALWGLAIWVIGYEGWLPAAGIRPATTDFPPSRWPIPIANHLLYGVVTAMAFDHFRQRLEVAEVSDSGSPSLAQLPLEIAEL